ncbi:AlbA family DNA-binding domain-containing protein [Lysinibacillus irui]|uniref:AlbA family DNA-binding domain-containing protein n=1 Tax=Lysinibacillus irui TaxID=2998077 RepID=UPI002AD29E17|nr:ATP-binding protein [Lysinibacillus irui]MEA0564469.1 ATP-binding protein [Lysinibacillus irui]
MENELLVDLLNQTEHEGLDFKKGFYVKQSYEELLKDVLAMANAKIKGSRYIIFGVKENAQQLKDIFEITNPVDAATYQQIILENIEPQLVCHLIYVNYQEKRITVLEIPEPNEQPYLLKHVSYVLPFIVLGASYQFLSVLLFFSVFISSIPLLPVTTFSF